MLEYQNTNHYMLDDPKYKYHNLKYFDKIIINLE
jgi:hypothetical protein